ncbi:MAG: PilN domain-containing protein [Fibrobacterota bacterium]
MVEKIEINLIPNEYRVYRRKLKLPKDMLISIFISLGLILIPLMIWAWQVNARNNLESQIAEVSRRIEDEREVEQKIESLKEKREEALAMLNGLSSIPLDHGEWITLLELYCREIPPNTWLTDIEGAKIMPDLPGDEDDDDDESGDTASGEDVAGDSDAVDSIHYANKFNVVVKGATESFGEVGQYMARLKNVPGIESVDVIEVNSSSDGSGFTFELRHGYENQYRSN